MSKEPFISFVVPVYNVKSYLPQCIDSLLGQTFKEIEFIFVDDCSTDGSYDILLDYQKKDDRIKVFRLEKNSRQGAARNYGIRQSTGTYLSFLDSDDWLDVSFAQDMYNAVISTDADYVRGGAIDFYSPEKMIQETSNYRQYTIQTDREALLREICLNGARMWGGCIKRNIIIDNKLWYPEGVAYEDNPVGIFHYFLSHKIVCLNKDYYYYRCNNTSTTRSSNIQSVLDRIYTNNLLLENAKRLCLYDRYKDLFNSLYIKLMATTLRLLIVQSETFPKKYLNIIYNSLSSIDRHWYNKKGHRKFNIIDFYIERVIPLSVPILGYPFYKLISIYRSLK